MAKILGQKLPGLKAGYLVSTLHTISRGTPEDTTALPYGAIVKVGSATGHYEALDGTELNDDGVIGVVVFDKTHIEYNGVNESIAFGKYGDILIAGDIVVPVSDDTTDLTDIVEGGKVYLGSDGKVSVAVGQTPKPLTAFRFLGITEEVDGVALTQVRKREF